MPSLNKPAVPVSFPLEEAVKSIEGTLKAKNWHEFKVASLTLKFVPFYFFNFSAFTEKEKDGQKVVGETFDGESTINAVSSDLWDELPPMLKAQDTKVAEALDLEYDFELQEPKLSLEEAKRAASLKIASRFTVSRENVELSGMHLVFVPFWIAFVSVAEGNYRVVYSAVNGEVVSSEEIPEREKGWLEVTEELLQELKNPGAWLKYSKQAVEESAAVFRKKSAPGSGFSFFNLLYIVLIIVLILLILDYLQIVSL